ncbi:MAG: hypothetical protein KDA20_11760 [Phycisphaerales bacterium]|nr:hypothetical protein [Phycisphaerales bacterium]
MLKFLRKYQGIILVFGGVLLMIAFLIPQALQKMGKGAGAQVVGTIDGGRTLSGKDYLRAKRELEIVYTVMPEFVSRWDVSVEHWLLLTVEADRNGLRGGELDGQNFFARMVDETVTQFNQQRTLQGRPMVDDEIAAARKSLLDQMNASVDSLHKRGYADGEIYTAIGKLSGVWRLINLLQPSLPLSMPEAWAVGMELYDTVTADIVALTGDDLAPDPGSLTDAQLSAHFQTYAAQRPMDNEFGIGYRQPDAVRLEMLRLDRSALNDAIEVDPIELRLHFDDLQANNILPGKTFEEVRDQVRASYVSEQSGKLMDELVLDVRREMLKSRVGMQMRDGFAVLPQDWATKRPTLDALANAVRAKLPHTELGGQVVDVRPDDGALLDGGALAVLPGANGATFRVNERVSVPFAEYILGVRELGRGDTRFALQQGFLPAEPMRVTNGAGAGDVIWVRITGVRKEGPATDWRTIETRVRDDLASIEGFNALEVRQSEFVTSVANVGVATVLDMNMPGAAYNLDGKVTRQIVRLADNATPFPEGNVQHFRDAIMDLVKPWDPTLDVATLPLDQRTTSALDQATRRLVIGQVTGRTPMTIEQFSRNIGSIINRARVQASDSSRLDPVSFDAIKQRLGYRPAERSKKGDEALLDEEQAEE